MADTQKRVTKRLCRVCVGGPFILHLYLHGRRQGSGHHPWNRMSMPPHPDQGWGRGTMDRGGHVTIAEASARLGVSEKTLRRWIRSGKIHAAKVEGPYGMQYDLADADLEDVSTALAVVEKATPADPHALALAIAEALTRRDEQTAAAIDALRQEISDLRDELRTKPARRTLWPWQKQP